MKKIIFSSLFLVAMTTSAIAGPNLIGVHRWCHGGNQDWVTFAEGEVSDAALAQSGYYAATFQYLALKHFDASFDLVRVYKWWNENDKDWVSLAEDEISELTLQSWGYTNAQFQFFAFRSIPANTNFEFAPVSRWFHPMEKDWISLRDNEFTEEQLKSWGYEGKIFQYYVITGIK